jgi:hypothetical protein
MTPSEQLVDRLVADFPSLAPLLADHRADQNGETLPYLFMADVARWAQQDVATHPEAVGDVVDWLEHEFVVAEPAEKDLIGLGFVEAISYPPDGATLLLRLGPALTHVAGELGLLPAAD